MIISSQCCFVCFWCQFWSTWDALKSPHWLVLCWTVNPAKSTSRELTKSILTFILPVLILVQTCWFCLIARFGWLLKYPSQYECVSNTPVSMSVSVMNSVSWCHPCAKLYVHLCKLLPLLWCWRGSVLDVGKNYSELNLLWHYRHSIDSCIGSPLVAPTAT